LNAHFDFVQEFPTLVLKQQQYTHTNGSSVQLLMADGTLPMYYQVCLLPLWPHGLVTLLMIALETHDIVPALEFARCIAGSEVQHPCVDLAARGISQAATHHVCGANARHDYQTTALLCGSFWHGLLPLPSQLGLWKVNYLPAFQFFNHKLLFPSCLDLEIPLRNAWL